jgi:Zn-dependent protease
MLGWSIPLFRVRGIPLSLHWSFFLLLAYWADAGWQDEGWNGARWNSAMLICFFGCVVLHELGHCLTARRFGIGTRRILLMPIGGMADMEEIPRQPAREILMTLAGPAVNFAIAGALWLVVRHFKDDVPLYSLDGLLNELFGWNLVMGCFNLVPVFPMDGGRIFRALLATRLPYVRATFWAASVGKVLAVAGIFTALAAPRLHLAAQPLYMPAVLFTFIFVVGEMEYRLVLRREQEAAHWQNWWARRESITIPNEPIE